MLNDTFYRIRRIDGLQQLQQRGEGNARELSSLRLRLTPGGTQRYQIAGEETVLVLQEGKGTFATPDGSWKLSRTSVFDERGSAIYLPPGAVLTVAAETALEAILFSTPAPAGGNAAVVTPAEVDVNARGKGNFSREVHNLFVTDTQRQAADDRRDVQSARQLEQLSAAQARRQATANRCSKRSTTTGSRRRRASASRCSTPPTARSTTHTVRDGDAVLLPYGYHPVAAPPGYKLYYLWALAGAERRIGLHEDPDTHVDSRAESSRRDRAARRRRGDPDERPGEAARRVRRDRRRRRLRDRSDDDGPGRRGHHRSARPVAPGEHRAGRRHRHRRGHRAGSHRRRCPVRRVAGSQARRHHRLPGARYRRRHRAASRPPRSSTRTRWAPTS